jgi:outer membrane protein insertion porin family
MLGDKATRLATLLTCAVALASGQAGPTANPSQAPRTAPQTEEVLSSYEGQKVLSVELAGQPDLNTDALLPVIQQRANQPFSRAKADATISALKSKGYQAVEVDLRPEADGIRLLFVLRPAIYFGIYTFPEATSKFAYSRLLQIADYPPRGPYTPLDINSSQEHLTHFFQQSGYFQAEVKPQIEVDKTHGIVNVVYHHEFWKACQIRQGGYCRSDARGNCPSRTCIAFLDGAPAVVSTD